MKVQAEPSENIETEVKHLNSNEKLAKYLTDIVNEVTRIQISIVLLEKNIKLIFLKKQIIKK